MAVFAIIAAVVVVAGSLVFATDRASAATVTFTVESAAAPGGTNGNADPGNGACVSGTPTSLVVGLIQLQDNGSCTLEAAIEEVNAESAATPANSFVINFAAGLGTLDPSTGTFMSNDTLNKCNTVTVLGVQLASTCGASSTTPACPAVAKTPDNVGDVGSMFCLTASNTTIDFSGVQLGTGTYDAVEATMFSVAGSNDVFQCSSGSCGKGVLSSGSSFVFEPGATGDTIQNMSTAAIASYAPERFAVVRENVSGLTVNNVKLSGFYNQTTDGGNGGLFIFNSQATSAGSNPISNTTLSNITVDNSGTGACSSTSGVGCATSLLGFSPRSSNVTVNTMKITGWNVNGLPSGLDGFVFANHDDNGGSGSPNVSNLTFTGNRITNVVGNGTGEDYSTIVLPYDGHLTGTNTISSNVFTRGASGQTYALYYEGAQTASGNTVASGLTIKNNYFNGYTGDGIRLYDAGLVTVQGNAFGSKSSSQTASNGQPEEYTDGEPALLNNYHGINPKSSNQSVYTWYPSAAATVLTAAAPSGTLLATNANQAAGAAVCMATVNVQAPTAADVANNSSSAPASPVTLDLYWTAANDAEVYLGSVSGVTGATATVEFPIPIGSIALPDGSAQIVNPSSGVVGTGNVRVQTQVQGLSQLESSQYSRWVSLSGNCQPSLVISQRSDQAETTMARNRVFTVTSAMPIDPTTLTLSDIQVSGTAANARCTSITAETGGGLTPNTVFDVSCMADDSGTITISIPANAVASPSGITNQGAATTGTTTATDNTLSYVNPLQVTPAKFVLVTGDTVGQQYTLSTQTGAPLPTAALNFTSTLDAAATQYGVTPSTLAPAIAAGATSTTVTVTAAAGDVPADTKTTISNTVTSTDPNYNGLVVPAVNPYLFSTDPQISITKQAYIGVTGANTPANIVATGQQIANGGQLSDGTPVWFVFTVTNTSQDDWATTLGDITVTDDVLGPIGTVASLAQGASTQLVYAQNPVAISANGPAPTGGN